jgi:hypothetical protein
MKNLKQIELIYFLFKKSKEFLTNKNLEKYGITIEDINVLKASYLPDNFESESNKVKYYETYKEY